MIRRVAALLRRGGPGELRRAGRRSLRLLVARFRPYQAKTARSVDERWSLIEAALPAGCNTALDIGCNLGDYAARCAQLGLWTVGLDRSPKLVSRASKRYGATTGCAFMVMDLSPDEIDRLPEFDVVLLLSVHHHWLRAYGPDSAASMLRALGAKTRRVLVFEGPSRRSRYGDHAPDFLDNDAATVTKHHESYLQRELGDVFASLKPLGKAGCVGEREPYRWIYALYR